MKKRLPRGTLTGRANGFCRKCKKKLLVPTWVECNDCTKPCYRDEMSSELTAKVNKIYIEAAERADLSKLVAPRLKAKANSK